MLKVKMKTTISLTTYILTSIFKELTQDAVSMPIQKIFIWAFPYRVGLSVTSPRFAAGFPLLSLTQLTAKNEPIVYLKTCRRLSKQVSNSQNTHRKLGAK